MTSQFENDRGSLIAKLSEHVPHARAQGISFVSISDNRLTMCMPWREELVGNPATGSVHGGAITVLLDQTLGLANLCHGDIIPQMTPTLDLRIDHLAASTRGHDIYAVGWIYKATSRVMFAEGFAYCESLQQPIARATGSFVGLGELDVTAARDIMGLN